MHFAGQRFGLQNMDPAAQAAGQVVGEKLQQQAALRAAEVQNTVANPHGATELPGAGVNPVNLMYTSPEFTPRQSSPAFEVENDTYKHIISPRSGVG